MALPLPPVVPTPSPLASASAGEAPPGPGAPAEGPVEGSARAKAVEAPGSGLAVHAALLTVQVAFATLAIAGKIALRSIQPETLAFLRSAGAALLLCAFQVARGRPILLRGKDLWITAIAAALGVAANQLLFLAGLRRTTAIHATLLVATIPIVTVALSIALGRERAKAALLAGIGLAAAGVVVLVGPEGLSLSSETALGDLLVVVNCASYAGYLVLIRDVLRRRDALDVMPTAFLCAAAYVLPFAWGDLSRGPALFAPEGTRLLALYIVLVPTVLAYGLNAWALGRTSASIVAAYTYLQPLLAAVLAVTILGEALHPRVGGAAALVLLGLVLVQRGRS